MLKFRDNRGEVVDFTKLEREIRGGIAGVKDTREVKLPYMLFSQVGPERFQDGFSLAYQDELKNYGGELLMDTRVVSKDDGVPRFDARFMPVVPSERFFYHEAGIPQEKNLESIRTYHVWGNPLEKVPTYLKYDSVNDSMGAGGGEVLRAFDDFSTRYVVAQRLTIDRDVLLKTRSVFWDPEGLIIPEEHDGTFIVFGGIPCQAITKYEVVVKK
jgi:hypothetical protein